MTPQHPAAPEGESEVGGLTEAERASLRRDILNRYYLRGIATNETGLMATAEAACDVLDAYVAERVRVVESERDSWRETAIETHKHMDHERTRAESAEAALAALRAGVEALVEEWAATPDFRAYYADHARSLRALLAGGGA